MEGMMLRTAV